MGVGIVGWPGPSHDHRGWHPFCWNGKVIHALFVLLLLQEDLPKGPPVPPKDDPAFFLNPIQGTLTLRYRYRATSTDSDSDLYQFLTLSYGDPQKDAYTAALSARFAEDLDGNQSVRGYYPFTSLDDSYRSSATQRLYAAYLEARPPDSGITVRAGRQTLEDVPEAVLMDGALVRLQVGSHVQLSMFGGIPVNLFESSPQGDAMYGASAEWIPDPSLPGRYRVEYLHITDNNLFGLHKDNLIGISMDEGAGIFRFHARYTLLEGTSHDLVARLSGSFPDAGFLVDFQGTYNFHQVEALSYALDPFASFMMALEPYVDLVARASKSFGEIVAVDASFTSRQLIRQGVETTYNHAFKRVEVTPKLLNWPLPGITVSLSGDFWDSSAATFSTLGGDVSWALHRDIVLSAGSSYALYSIDAFTGEEHDRVRLYTASLRWKVARGSSFDVRYTLEVNAVDTFRIIEFGFRHAF